MKYSKLSASFVAALVASVVSVQAESVAVDGSSTKFESSISETVGGQAHTLEITGTALREKAWFNVYAIASYAPAGAAKTAEELAAADVPKKLHLVMERDVEGKKMSDAFKEAIEANHSKKDFEAELKAFEEYFQANPVKQGDAISFVNEPGVGLVCKVAATEAITIKNPKFSKAVWEIYFGDKNIGDAIKKSLTSRLK